MPPVFEHDRPGAPIARIPAATMSGGELALARLHYWGLLPWRVVSSLAMEWFRAGRPLSAAKIGGVPVRYSAGDSPTMVRCTVCRLVSDPHPDGWSTAGCLGCSPRADRF